MDKSLENSRTFENLRQAFYEEASLALRYQFFAIVAEFEGMDRAAGLFKDFSQGGRLNVHGCLDFLRLARDPSADIPIGSTRKNLESAVQSETLQLTELYPEMARVARDEGFTDIASWFDTLEKLKRSHLRKLKGVGHEG